LGGRKEFTMPRTHAPYPSEYRRRVVDLARAGRSTGSLAREFRVSTQTIRNWVRQADLDDGRRSDGLTTDERAELVKLRRENKRLRIEQEILKKAAAWFARETDTVPSKGSDS
jgi:transposase